MHCEKCGTELKQDQHTFSYESMRSPYCPLCRRNANKPSKESLERAIIATLHEKVCASYDACPTCIRVALEFDAIAKEHDEVASALSISAAREIEVRELRDQNAALVSALRGVVEHVYAQNDYSSRDYQKYYTAVDAARQALAPYAPAEEAQGKPASGTEG